MKRAFLLLKHKRTACDWDQNKQQRGLKNHQINKTIIVLSCLFGDFFFILSVIYFFLILFITQVCLKVRQIIWWWQSVVLTIVTVSLTDLPPSVDLLLSPPTWTSAKATISPGPPAWEVEGEEVGWKRGDSLEEA